MEKILIILLSTCLIIAFISRLYYYVTLGRSTSNKHNKEEKERGKENK